MKWSALFAGLGVALGLVLVHQTGVVPCSGRVRRGRLTALLDPGSLRLFDGEVPAWARLLHPSRVWLRWRGAPRGLLACRIVCDDPADLPVAERFVRDQGWLADVRPSGTPPPAGPLVSLFMGRLPARTGGEAYDVEVARELMRRGCRVEYHWVSLLRWLPFAPLLLAARRGLFLVDEHFLGPLRLANALRRGPLVVIAHHLEGYRSGEVGPGRSRRRAALSRADRIVVVSASTGSEVASLGIDPGRLAQVPPGFEADSLPTPSPPRPVAREFLFVGLLTPRKGVAHLLEAWARLPRGVARLRLVGASDGAYASRILEPLARALEGEVRFEGRVERDRLAALYAQADVLVLPSLQEGFGIVALEAMHCGLAVVASRVDALPEIVEDGVTGLLTPAGDPEALARVLRRLVEEPGLRSRLGREGRRRAPRYSWSRTRAEFWEAVRPFLEAPGGLGR